MAARFNYAALGSDTGGSIRLPAAACGVTGIKPTQTRVSRYGVMPLSFSCDNVGPLCRTARDCARIMTLIAGRDPRDPTSSHLPVPDYEAALDGDLRGLRIGVPTDVFLRRGRCAGGAGDGSARWRCWRRAARRSSASRLPLMDAVSAYVSIISRVEAATIHAQWMRNRAAGLRRAYQRPDVSGLCHPGDLLRRGAEPARADPEGVRGRGVRARSTCW